MEHNTNKTQCECPLAGYCDRHEMNKNIHYHNLCQNHQGYFNAWEKGMGPGQKGKKPKSSSDENQTEPKPKPKPVICKFCKNTECTGECRNNNQLPPATEMAKNLATATKDHIKSGLQTVSEEEIKRRLDVCADCEHFIPHSARCKLCGCFTKFKAKLKSGGCPINKW
jgi:hypothetical protein